MIDHIINSFLMKNTLTLLLALALTASSLYTSSHWTKQGYNLRDGIANQSRTKSTFVDTSCKDVNLTSPPYSHNGLVWSGYLNVKKAGSALGFIFYGKEGVTNAGEIKNYPTIIWLNGGPGSSSQLGNFMELGPIFVKGADMAPWEIVKNNNTWVKDYNVIFVDQPVGTGLSYADPNHPSPYCKNMAEVAEDFWNALNQLYHNPNGCFKKVGIEGSHPLFIFGQSYGGKYAPAIAERIKSEQVNNKGFITGLKGVAIGDGFVHPYDILSQVGEYAFNLGLLDYQERSAFERLIMNSTYQKNRHFWQDMHDTFDLVVEGIAEVAGGVNVYDITKYHPYPTKLLDAFLESPDIKSMFKLNQDIIYNSQGGNVYEFLFKDFMMPYVELVEKLLNFKTNVLVYSGQNDLIVETPGTFKWAEWARWERDHEFRDTLMKPWKVGDKVVGFNKIVGNFELRTVNDAGHLVPMDQGEAAREMVKSFVQRSL